jgi:hypothetical protein
LDYVGSTPTEKTKKLIKIMIKKNLTLFFVAFLQVALVSMNVIFITKGYIICLLLTGFGISYSWTYNVKRIAIGTHLDRFIYACGAAFGTLIGFYLANYLITVL